MPPALPRRLRYLRPVLDELAAVPPHELNEDNDRAGDLVEAALQQRVAGMMEGRATRRLTDDLRALRAWLALPHQAESPGHFVVGYLLGMTGFPEVVLSEAAAEQPPEPSGPRIGFDPPEGFQITSRAGRSLFASGDGVIASLHVTDALTGPILGELVQLGPDAVTAKLMADGHTEAQAHAAVDAALQIHKNAAITIDAVQFGPVSGTKYHIRINTGPGAASQTVVHYALRVPGGLVQASLTVFCGDERAFESQLATLRVE
jgi:hypothetical protein